MARQGSLRQETARCRCKSLARVCLRALLLTMLGFLIATDALAAGIGELPATDVRVVFEFQSASPRTWNFRLRLADAPDSQASLTEIRNLSSAETTSGIFHMDRGGQMLAVHSRHAIAAGKFELRIRGSREAKLWVEPFGKPTTEGQLPPPREIAIIDLLNGDRLESEPPATGAAGTAGWSIQRVTTDRLRLDDLQPVPVYRPGVPLEFSVHVNGMTDHASQPRVLHYELYRVADGEIVETRHWPVELDAFGNSQKVSVSESIPDIPGVYELRLQLEFDEETIWSRLRRRPPPLVRVTHSIAVLHGEVAAETGEPIPWREVGRIRPSESTWSVGQWLPKPNSRLIPGASIPQLPDLQSDAHAGQSVSLLPALGTFQATLPVQTAGYPHKVTIRIPSTSTADLQVEIGRSQQEVTTSFVLESDATADQQGLWREHTFVHYPVDDDQIWLTNLDATNPTPFDSIAVQAGPLYLAPHAKPGGTTESARAALTRTVAMRMSNLEWTDGLIADVSKRADFSECAPSTIALNGLWFAAERAQDEARASGFNGIVIPANSGARTWYASSLYQSQDDSLASRHHRLETLLQLLESSQLRIYVELTPNMLVTELERTIQQQESLLVELTRSESGNQTSGSGAASTETVSSRTLPSRTQYNPLHPLVQNAIGGLVKELSDLCNRYDGFTGVIVDCGGTSHLRPAQNASADAGSILLFGRGNHPSSSVAQLRSWIQQQGGEAFQNWERVQLQQCYAQIGKATDAGMVRLLIARIAAVDAADAAKTVSMVSSLRYGPAGVLAKKSSMQHKLMNLAGPLPAVLLGEEAPAGAPALVREQLSNDLCRMINRADPELLLVDRSLLAHRQDRKLSGTLRSFCALPNHPLAESSPIDSASHTVRLRSGTFDGHLYVAMTSEVPWNTDVDLETTTPAQWKVVGRTDTADLTQFSGGTRTRVTIPTGQMVVLRTSEPSSSAVRSWTTRVAGGPEAIESIKQKVTLIVERIGILNDFTPYASLTNGGFEQSGDMGLIGWLHAQHPPGCVELDDKEFAEGSHSVMLTTITPAVSRTWLVSETIDPPQSGRLAVSLACKAEASADESPHLLRVSIEATRQGGPIRFTRDLEVARNGQWNQRDVILEADEIDTTSIESLRLTIDSLSGGRVWIDDVQLHDRFPTEKERTELQSQAFLAVQGLQRGKLLPTGKLLQNHWARHLLTLGAIETSKPATEVLPAPAEPPSVTERIRNWLPRPLRF